MQLLQKLCEDKTLRIILYLLDRILWKTSYIVRNPQPVHTHVEAFHVYITSFTP